MGEGTFGSMWPTLAMFFIVFYFFFIAPTMKKNKQAKKFNNELKKGDKVITIGGIHGKIFEMNKNDNTCILETMAGKLKIDRSGISVEKSLALNKPPAVKK